MSQKNLTSAASLDETSDETAGPVAKMTLVKPTMQLTARPKIGTISEIPAKKSDKKRKKPGFAQDMQTQSMPVLPEEPFAEIAEPEVLAEETPALHVPGRKSEFYLILFAIVLFVVVNFALASLNQKSTVAVSTPAVITYHEPARSEETIAPVAAPTVTPPAPIATEPKVNIVPVSPKSKSNYPDLLTILSKP